MIQHVQAALEAFFAKNINHESGELHEYGICVLGVNERTCRAEFRFLRGCDYCCFELGCHCGLYESDAWHNLDALLRKQDLDPGDISQVSFQVVVEEGARNQSNERMFGESVSRGYAFTSSFQRV